jgi:hypothetical protein
MKYKLIYVIFGIKTSRKPRKILVRIRGYRSRGPGFDSRRFQIFWEAAGLERGPLGLVWTTEELLGRNIAAPV